LAREMTKWDEIRAWLRKIGHDSTLALALEVMTHLMLAEIECAYCKG